MQSLFNHGPNPAHKDPTMKRWIKRTLIAVFGFTALFGGIAAFAQHRHHEWRTMSAEDAAAMKTRMVDKVGKRLDLDAAQKAKLGALADAMQAQHAALRGSSDPRVEVQGLIAGNTFDRAKASALIEAKVSAVTTASPAVVSAMADFYDSLKPEQQTQVREFMQRHRHHG